MDGGAEKTVLERFNEAIQSNGFANNEASMGNLHNMEFRYYNSVIRQHFQKFITTHTNRAEVVLKWLSMLHGPSYNIPQLRDKRNRIIMRLTMNLVNSRLDEMFLQEPKSVLPDIYKLKPKLPETDWEKEKNWETILADKIAEDREAENDSNKSPPETCVVHGKQKCPTDNPLDKSIGLLLDKHFRYYLHIIIPRIALLAKPAERLRATKWIQILCTIPPIACSMAKGLRNDYMSSLLGYVQNNQLIGPFADLPPNPPLVPLCEYANLVAEKRPPMNPTHPKTDEFMKNMPHPEEGAFVFVSMTGDLQEMPRKVDDPECFDACGNQIDFDTARREATRKTFA